MRVPNKWISLGVIIGCVASSLFSYFSVRSQFVVLHCDGDYRHVQILRSAPDGGTSAEVPKVMKITSIRYVMPLGAAINGGEEQDFPVTFSISCTFDFSAKEPVDLEVPEEDRMVMDPANSSVNNPLIVQLTSTLTYEARREWYKVTWFDEPKVTLRPHGATSEVSKVDALNAVVERLARRGIKCRDLEVNVRCPKLESALERLKPDQRKKVEIKSV